MQRPSQDHTPSSDVFLITSILFSLDYSSVSPTAQNGIISYLKPALTFPSQTTQLWWTWIRGNP